MTTHLMVDTETLSTRVGGIVTSVAFVRFSDEAHCAFNLSVTDQQALGLEIDPKTEAWWATQDPVARQLALANPLPLASALPYLVEWIKWAAPDGDFLLWCHGATFDAAPAWRSVSSRGHSLPVDRAVLARPMHADAVQSRQRALG